MNKYCNITGVGIMVGNQGTVRAKGKKIEARDAVIIDRVEEIAEKRGWKMSQVALT